MSKTLRRFEVLLPLRFNDGQPVPDEIIAETLLEWSSGSVLSPAKPNRSEDTGAKKGNLIATI